MVEGRSVFIAGIVLAACAVLLNIASSALDDRRAAPGPTASASPTAPSDAVAATAVGCPAEAELPEDIDARVCTWVNDDELAAIEPTEDIDSGRLILGFRSPSGSIACADVRGRTVACAVKGWTFEADGLARGQTVVVSAGRALPNADVRPPAGAVDRPAGFAVPVLRFGQVVRMNAGWFCGVQEIGVSCWSPKAKSGLLVSRSAWTTWTPEGIEGAA